MVRTDPLPICRTIALEVKPTSNNQIFPIVENTNQNFIQETGIEERFVLNGFIPELRAFSSIRSLDSVPLPNYTLEDSDTDKLLKTQQLMWGEEAKRFDLCIWVSKNSAPTKWIQTGTLPLTNSAGYPYTLHNPLDLLTTNLSFQFGRDACLGVSIKDASWGLPTSIDTINIFGNWTQDGRIIQPDYVPIPINVQGATVQQVVQYRNENTFNTATAKRVLLDANQKRITATIKNNSGSATLYLSETDQLPTASVNDGTIAAGVTRTIRAGYLGSIYGAASASGTSTTVVEIYNQ